MALGASTTSTLLSRRDLRFLLHEWLGVEQLSERPRYADQSAELYDDVLELAEQLATDKFAPHNRSADAAEPYIGADGTVVLVPEVKPAVEAFAEAGLLGTTMPESVGGMGLPHVIGSAAFAWFQAANVGTSGYPFLTVGAANLLLANGSREQIETWVTPMVEGRFCGTMCLSETQAGSSLADITTRAEPQDGRHLPPVRNEDVDLRRRARAHENIVHLVLAKVPGGPAGRQGNLAVHRPAIPRCGGRLIGAAQRRRAGWSEPQDGLPRDCQHGPRFRRGRAHRPGGQRGAVGYLVGEEHRGLSYMFHMMNEARIGVGLGATCLGYTGYLKALRYARERPQGRLADSRRTRPPRRSRSSSTPT